MSEAIGLPIWSTHKDNELMISVVQSTGFPECETRARAQSTAISNSGIFHFIAAVLATPNPIHCDYTLCDDHFFIIYGAVTEFDHYDLCR